MKSIVFVVFACMAMPSVGLNAQIFDRISREVDRAADQLTQKITDKMVEGLIEKLFSGQSIDGDTIHSSVSSTSRDTSNLKTNASSSAFDLSSIFSGSSVDKTKVFDFTHRMKMEMVSTESTRQFDYYFNETDTYIGVDISSMFVVLEVESQKTYAIVNDQLISMNMSKIMDKMAPKGTEGENITVTKTGRSETIVGFPCDEYIIESDESILTAWITQDFINQNIENTAFIQNIRDQKNTNINGALLRYTYQEKDTDKGVIKMNVLEFVAQKKQLALSDY